MQTLEEEAENLKRKILIIRPEHECADHLDIRLRTFQGSDKKHFVYQCTRCGKQRRGPIKEAEARHQLKGREPRMFDFNIEVEFDSSCRAIHQRLADIHDELNPSVREYLEDINQQRTDSKERDQSIVEGAFAKLLENRSKSQAIDVALRHLLPIRKELRSEQAAEVNRFSTEEDLKAWVQPYLEKDFEVFPEVTGRHLSGVPVVIDFLLHPRPHLIEHGFVKGFVGLEVKYITQENGFSRKSSRALWQTISYTDSEFFVHGKKVSLTFAALFSNLSFQNEEGLLITYGGHQSENDKAEWRAMRLLANHANVGILNMRGSRDDWRGWSFSFAAGSQYFTHWSSSKERKSGFVLHDKNLIEKRRVGNF